MPPAMSSAAPPAQRRGPSRPFVGAVAFLTLVDLFAAQAIVSELARAYAASPGAMGVAVNAATLGMAAGSLGVAVLARGIDRRKAVAAALALLALPTAALAAAPDLASFAALRVAQGLCMATAFSLTLAALGELLSGPAAAGAFAAYVTGNVASNLVGRMLAAGAVGQVGLEGTFLMFAALNLAGALMVWRSGHHAPGAMGATKGLGAALADLKPHLAQPELRAAFGLGFCILFAFIGVFTYVNFVLTAPPLGLPMMSIGLVYLVFLPSLPTTLAAGPLAARIGARPTIRIGLGVAALGLVLLLSGALPAVLAGLALVGVGTFAAQAVATGYVGRTALTGRAAASGLYLASYFAGGLAGAWALGQAFELFGWKGVVVGVGLALVAGALLAGGMRSRASRPEGLD